ncbi:MAG: DUF3788 family protein [bacterium]|nr:DUF3788 family protein [bacterium]
MFDSIFKDKSNPPTDSDLVSHCGQYTKPILELTHKFADNFEWKMYSRKAGWTKKYILNGKTLCFVQPHDGRIEVIFNLNANDERIIEESSQFPKEIKEEIRKLEKYVEGKSYRFFISDRTNLKLADKFLRLKLSET